MDLLNENGTLISASNLQNEEEAKYLCDILTEYGFFIKKLESIIYRGIFGFEGYTKIVLTKKFHVIQIRKKVDKTTHTSVVLCQAL